MGDEEKEEAAAAKQVAEEKAAAEEKANAPYDGEPDALVKMCDTSSAPDIAKVNDLIQRGINLRYKDRIGCTALYGAASFDHTDVVKILLQADPSTDHIRKQVCSQANM